MPIGGRTFTVQNKILPGAYINFVSLGSVVKMGTRGVAALPLELNWGPENKVFSVYAEDFNKNALSVFGYDPTADDILLVKEALKRARTLMIYRVNSGSPCWWRTTSHTSSLWMSRKSVFTSNGRSCSSVWCCSLIRISRSS